MARKSTTKPAPAPAAAAPAPAAPRTRAAAAQTAAAATRAAPNNGATAVGGPGVRRTVNPQPAAPVRAAVAAPRAPVARPQAPAAPAPAARPQTAAPRGRSAPASQPQQGVGGGSLMDAWADAREGAKSGSGTTVDVGPYLGAIVSMDTIQTDSGKKVKIVLDPVDPPQYANSGGKYAMEVWAGPFDDPNNRDAMRIGLSILRSLGVETDNLTGPDDINEGLCQSVLDCGHIYACRVSENKGYLNTRIKDIAEIGQGAPAADPGTGDASEQPVGEAELASDDVIGPGMSVAYTGADGSDRSALCDEVRDDGMAVITDDENGQQYEIEVSGLRLLPPA